MVGVRGETMEKQLLTVPTRVRSSPPERCLRGCDLEGGSGGEEVLKLLPSRGTPPGPGRRRTGRGGLYSRPRTHVS